MSRNKHPFQVLVTTGDAALLGAGNEVPDLAVGQIGLFDADTNLSIDGTALVRNFYLAVGVDSTGGSTFDSANFSAGQKVQTKNVTNYQKNVYNAATAQVITLGEYTADCEEDYSIKFEFKNALLRQRMGFVGYNKTYAIRSGCCEGCEECPSGDCVDVTEAMVDAINADADDLVTAVAISGNEGTIEVTTGSDTGADCTVVLDGVSHAVTLAGGSDADADATAIAAVLDAIDGWNAVAATDTVTLTKDAAGGLTTLTLTAGTTGIVVTIVEPVPVEVTDYDAFKLSDPTLCLGIKMTLNPISVDTFCNVPKKFYKPLQTTALVSGQDGFDCNGTITTVVNAVMEEGTGRYVQQLEYRAGGWNGRPGPYRASEATGLARDGFDYFASTAVNYDLISLEYELYSLSGWQEHMNAVETIIAVPTGDSTTLAALYAALDNLLGDVGFPAQV